MDKDSKNAMESWKYTREKGMWAYMVSKTATLGVMMVLIYVLNLFLSEGMNYFLTAVIYIGIVILTPALAWLVNEYRYKKKSGTDERSA